MNSKFLKDNKVSMVTVILMILFGILSAHKGDVASTVLYMGLLNMMTSALLSK